ncbi:MAG TPA: dihydropteroate synthase [Thermoplasmata archaeon]|nr:dihydropteroate synthase [Thermoplasmata archaeon]
MAARATVVPAPLRTLRWAGGSIELGGRTRILGVVNVTPDSFSDGGAFLEPTAAVERALRLAEEGADLIDIGGESTRPGATELELEEEWGRVGPVLEGLHGRLARPISIDTRHPVIAQRALDAGASIVNDVSGLRDPEMRRVVARTGAAAVVMHMRGTPATMVSHARYVDVVGEVGRELTESVRRARVEGIGADRILIDPGLGFAKTAAQSLELLTRLGELATLGYPVLVGASRKSFLGSLGGGDAPSDRLEASLAAAVVAALSGAAVVRVHDVAPTVRALAVADAIRRGRERMAEVRSRSGSSAAARSRLRQPAPSRRASARRPPAPSRKRPATRT